MVFISKPGTQTLQTRHKVSKARLNKTCLDLYLDGSLRCVVRSCSKHHQHMNCKCMHVHLHMAILVAGLHPTLEGGCLPNFIADCVVERCSLDWTHRICVQIYCLSLSHFMSKTTPKGTFSLTHLSGKRTAVMTSWNIAVCRF